MAPAVRSDATGRAERSISQPAGSEGSLAWVDRGQLGVDRLPSPHLTSPQLGQKESKKESAAMGPPDFKTQPCEPAVGMGQN